MCKLQHYSSMRFEKYNGFKVNLHFCKNVANNLPLIILSNIRKLQQGTDAHHSKFN